MSADSSGTSSTFNIPNMSQPKLMINKDIKITAVAIRKKRKSLPKVATDFLKQWLLENKHHPYPEEKVKALMAEKFNLTVTQVNNWFINNRRRLFRKIFPEHVRTPVFVPKRGAGKSIKRRKPESLSEDLTSSSSDEISPPPKLRRAAPVLNVDDLSPVESTDSDSSRDNCEKLEGKSFGYDYCLTNRQWCNLILIAEAAVVAMRVPF